MKILNYSIVLLLSMTLWGCGKGNSAAPAAIDPVTGKHVTVGWSTPDAATGLPIHATAVNGYYALPESCKGCHGEKLTGGASKVSCSNPGRNGLACHARFPHVDGFGEPAIHGKFAKFAATGLNGMAHCQKCHGSDYTGKGDAKNCISCHKVQGTNKLTNAPHAGNWATYLNNSNNLNHSRVHVSNAAACAQCHTGKVNLSAVGKARLSTFKTPGPGGCFDNSLCHNQVGHPPYTPVAMHKDDARNDVTCGISCHAIPAIPGVSNPRFNVNFPTSTGLDMSAGCETANCHDRAGLAHPYMWLPGRGTTGGVANVGTHALSILNVAACRTCHNGIEQGPIQSPASRFGAPSCMTGSVDGTRCHATTPVDPSSGNTKGCASCHGNPPNTNKHAAHLPAIPGLACAACHVGRGSGYLSHASLLIAHTKTNFDTTFQSQNGGAASFSANTCSNVSCHGGKETLSWVSGSVGTDCFACHKDYIIDPPAQLLLAQYNDYNSGDGGANYGMPNLHRAHVDVFGIKCLDCHDANLLVAGTGAFNKHFSYLDKHDITGTAVYDSPVRRASQSIVFSDPVSSYNPNGIPPQKGTCLDIGCHFITPPNVPW